MEDLKPKVKLLFVNSGIIQNSLKYYIYLYNYCLLFWCIYINSNHKKSYL